MTALELVKQLLSQTLKILPAGEHTVSIRQHKADDGCREIRLQNFVRVEIRLQNFRLVEIRLQNLDMSHERPSDFVLCVHQGSLSGGLAMEHGSGPTHGLATSSL